METSTFTDTPVGEYYLRGVMETASGFRINEDSTFQFFFSQGALDRFGEGTWQTKGDSIILNSRKKPRHDFSLVRSGKEAKNGIEVRIIERNTMLLRYVKVTIHGNGKIQEVITDDEGIARFDMQPVDKIELLFAFCPEKISVFTIDNKEHTTFEFAFEEWMMEYFFEDFKMKISDKELTGRSPILDGETFNYTKQGD